jgi:hypothetical protein
VGPEKEEGGLGKTYESSTESEVGLGSEEKESATKRDEGSKE